MNRRHVEYPTAPTSALLNVHNVRRVLADTKIPDEWRCRYKTGKCNYPRALKTNKKDGTDAMLLLCERHRRLQNKTKKRSDTKYKADRAMLRVVKRLHPDLVHHKSSTLRSNGQCPASPSSSLSSMSTDSLPVQSTTSCSASTPPSVLFSPSELDMLAFYLL
ncbi:hypothetical protein H310_09987 [Aphanomyces invadans]|uniref:Uncharacterized protein n=1 Tax=Aphanomyces invadans TaxID=157072 RepID=A0A024TT33_9STRA|nr:hypothetical protein H310_09987 [Aphanomyces invadans]ETV97198.1 hypothetical protein H310_09987 [Aphanomyces invadans]|eukprot:XP_008874444.1 hypothetical protein H310_09987 [Aphanomyces invadans]